MMKYFILLLSMMLLEAKVDIVVSPSCQIDELSSYEVKKLFMIKQTVIDNQVITVLDNKDQKLYQEFLKEYLNKSPRKMKVYWTRMLFTGKKVAPKKFSLKLVNSEENNNTCYMSYMEAKQKPQEWSILRIK